MGLISIIAALLLEQWHPLVDRRYLHSSVESYAGFLERHFNAGESQQGLIAWLLAVLPLALGAWLVHAVLMSMHTPVASFLAIAFNVLVLYLTMGFRQFSHYFTDIHLALKEDDLARAREVLGQWRGYSCEELTREEVSRLSIEGALIASHRHVFAVIFWFVLMFVLLSAGPSGAILYRLASFLGQRWGKSDLPDMAQFGRFSSQAFAVLDWLPVRFTATAFAVVGGFEEAVYCWRTQASKWADPGPGIVVAAGAGAIGVRLGNPIIHEGLELDRPEMGLGDEADIGFLDSTVGLVWRALILWLLMLLLLGIASAVS